MSVSQAFDPQKLQYRGKFGISTTNAVVDLVLHNVALDFDNTVMRKLIALNPRELSQRLSESGEVLVATKVDGEGTYVYFDAEGDSFSFSAGGRVRIGYPALDAMHQTLKAQGIKKALLRCELCLAHAPSSDVRVSESAHAPRRGVAEVIRISFSGSESELAQLKLVLLDLVMLDGKDLRSQQTNFGEQFKLMQQLAGTDASAAFHCMEGSIVAESAALARFQALVAQGHEGIVLRRLNRAETWKIKPHRTVDAVVIGYVEGEFEEHYGVTSLLTALALPAAAGSDPWLQCFARVGSGFSDELRMKLLEQVRALKIASPVAMTDSSGREIHFVKPQMVLELHGEDLLFSDAGKDQKSQLFSWNKAGQTYQFLGLSTCPRLSFARFASFREDKDWQAGGARSEQIGLQARPSSTALAQSVSAEQIAQIVRREVYAKGDILRKLVVVHKPAAEPFGYFVYWTDFSVKRAEPLKISVELASDLDRATALAERFKSENLPKGYVQIG